ncbi:MAG: chemotaxis-specific protein-glutamate methyltransferase CheB [Spirochaetia bacterium]|nr:chemotaxis-specific protein-glutamate methyltransferase CheB [Spirochaetia bacterium]
MAFKVLIVDDSALVRRAVKDVLGRVSGVEVCGEAENGQVATTLIEELKPNLMILDLEMPVLDGFGVLDFVKARGLKLPVIMLSAFTQTGAFETAKCLEMGAHDVIPKPDTQNNLGFADVEKMIIERVSGFIQQGKEKKFESSSFDIEKIPEKFSEKNFEMLVFGSSTGGPLVLHKILSKFPNDFPAPILIVQHMPPIFTKAFAERLNENCSLPAVEITDGEEIKKGHIYVTPGNLHALIQPVGSKKTFKLSNDDPRNSHRPSIDVSLESVVDVYKGNAVGVIMTGMGTDGANGMKLLHDNGGLTLAQDEDSSVIFGMNRRAIEMGGIIKIVTPDRIFDEIRPFFYKKVA